MLYPFNGRIPITLIILPVNPCSARWEKKRFVWHAVHSRVRWIASGGRPAASNCRRLASARSRWICGPKSLCPGARAVRKSIGYLRRIASESETSQNNSAA